MNQLVKYVGLDVHKETISVAVAEDGKRSESIPRIGAQWSCTIERGGPAGFLNKRYTGAPMLPDNVDTCPMRGKPSLVTHRPTRAAGASLAP